MSKYKAGDKVVLEMLSIDGDGYYIVGSEHYSWWASPKNLDEVVEPLSTYTEPLEAKIRRQAVEITRLLAENAELKKDLEYYHTGTDICDIESARTEGQQEAWGLARKCMLMNNIDREVIFGSGHNAMYGVLTYHTYPEAAAKVEAWERKKEEICVGDVVECEGSCGVVICDDFNVVSVITHNGSVIIRAKDKCKKTGRHIDVDAWLAQIGGENND